MRAINAVLLLALLLTFSGCVERPEAPAVSEQQATEEWKADGIVSEGEYTRSMLLQAPTRQGYSGGDMQISWRNDEEDLYLALNGSTLGWLALGFEPLEWMKDSDIILASVDKGTAVVLDEYCTGNYGPHIEDTMLGGTDDIQEFSGSESAGRTTIELKRSLQSHDRFDKSFTPGQAVSIIWALSDNPDISQKHDVAYGEGILSLTRAGGVASASLPGSLTPIEKDGLIFIWEEEKAARDIYSSLYEKNNLTIFLDLTRSEESHMDQAKAVIDKYGLVLPADVPGVFENQTLQDIHDRLLAEGLESDEQALKVAAEFEEISIMDLEAELAAAENEDVRTMYQGLLAGSRKHLRSYVADLKEQGIEYEPRHLLRSEFEETVRV
ncbi:MULTISPECIES: DUF2202 domain-containing protein [Methanothrix]|jgi:hypothetical protein|uniref:DOMON domain-containing protein n=1 Tax=hydrocarbon metagenome TaxID=938273 RepID=A0A0W8FC49_9ZZZZ|nr:MULTISPECIES: DUF2202 domain-containing protein [Methanothrix]OPX83034.1 MAG: DOMON domain protein [Methanosaeta sp. PtaB.Bin005]MDY0410719.1 DUF2202 domain-containing protein [Methanothrix soehngenii]HNQ53267.1 DUF2202 domain-containing protein [Methanothrix soehngenii]HOE45415.1 DUF2202 domain-containing protein [Methanothrix soehngenii]HOI20668.1 DUF2202 domain-containing protein [Methanothrix soehngenii]